MTSISLDIVNPTITLTHEDSVIILQKVAVLTSASRPGNSIALGLPTDGSFSPGAVTLSPSQVITDALDALNAAISSAADLTLAIPLGPPSMGDWSGGYLGLTDATLGVDTFQAMNVSLHAFNARIAAIEATVPGLATASSVTTLAGRVTTLEGAGYQTASQVSSAISSALGPYATTSALNGAISGEVTNRNTAITNAINTEVTNRNTAISNALTSYVTSSALTSTLAGYATTSALTSAISTEVTDRNNAITSALASYVTSSALTSTLASYVTNTSLATTLGSYATTSALSSAISTEVTNRNTAIATESTNRTTADNLLDGRVTTLEGYPHFPLASTSPTSVGTTKSIGSTMTAALADHVHDLPFSVLNSVIGTANASISVNSQRITGLATPTALTDAATKSYVDGIASGIQWKSPVRVATTANITLSGTQTIDAVAVIAGDRVLVKNQTTGSQNGIYVVAAGAWARATDADAAGELNSGAATFVSDGTVNSDTGWTLTTNDPITIGTTSQTWVQFTSLGMINAGNGLTKSGSTISALADADGSIVVGTGIKVGVLATDSQHGTRGGGSLHASATTSVAGFLPAADKQKLDWLDVSAQDTITGNFTVTGSSVAANYFFSGHNTHILELADGELQVVSSTAATTKLDVNHTVTALIDFAGANQISSFNWAPNPIFGGIQIYVPTITAGAGLGIVGNGSVFVWDIVDNSAGVFLAQNFTHFFDAYSLQPTQLAMNSGMALTWFNGSNTDAPNVIDTQLARVGPGELAVKDGLNALAKLDASTFVATGAVYSPQFSFYNNGTFFTELAFGKVALRDVNGDGASLIVRANQPIKYVAASYTMLIGDVYIGVTSTAAARTISLPALSTVTEGDIYTVKDLSGGAATNNITIDPNGSETIDGSATLLITSNYGEFSFRKVTQPTTMWAVS